MCFGFFRPLEGKLNDFQATSTDFAIAKSKLESVLRARKQFYEAMNQEYEGLFDF